LTGTVSLVSVSSAANAVVDHALIDPGGNVIDERDDPEKSRTAQAGELSQPQHYGALHCRAIFGDWASRKPNSTPTIALIGFRVTRVASAPTPRGR